MQAAAARAAAAAAAARAVAGSWKAAEAVPARCLFRVFYRCMTRMLPRSHSFLEVGAMLNPDLDLKPHAFGCA
jgi:hypothetical protein